MNHVVPVNDLREHVTNGDPCPCMPRTIHAVIEETGQSAPAAIVHNSYDRREVGEVCRHALAMLGVALADHEHTWTPAERSSFEHASHVLDMHWPAKPSEKPMRRPY